MVYCDIKYPSDKLISDLDRFWPTDYVWFFSNRVVVAVNEIFTDDLGPHKKLYLILSIDRFKIDYTVPYNEFRTYQRRLAL